MQPVMIDVNCWEWLRGVDQNMSAVTLAKAWRDVPAGSGQRFSFYCQAHICVNRMGMQPGITTGMPLASSSLTTLLTFSSQASMVGYGVRVSAKKLHSPGTQKATTASQPITF
jgi:hypothetical protein